jgi:hypothetical protein
LPDASVGTLTAPDRFRSRSSMTAFMSSRAMNMIRPSADSMSFARIDVTKIEESIWKRVRLSGDWITTTGVPFSNRVLLLSSARQIWSAVVRTSAASIPVPPTSSSWSGSMRRVGVPHADVPRTTIANAHCTSFIEDLHSARVRRRRAGLARPPSGKERGRGAARRTGERSPSCRRRRPRATARRAECAARRRWLDEKTGGGAFAPPPAKYPITPARTRPRARSGRS